VNDPPPMGQVPLRLANALFECYYGAGPRYHERFANGGMPPPTPMVRPEEETFSMEQAASSHLEGVPIRQWQPRGWEARKIQMQEEAEKRRAGAVVGTMTKPPPGE